MIQSIAVHIIRSIDIFTVILLVEILTSEYWLAFFYFLLRTKILLIYPTVFIAVILSLNKPFSLTQLQIRDEMLISRRKSDKSRQDHHQLRSPADTGRHSSQSIFDTKFNSKYFTSIRQNVKQIFYNKHCILFLFLISPSLAR